MTKARSWTDQPKELEGCDVIASLSLHRGDKNISVEVRHARKVPGFYLTFGNLFGSQTVYAGDGVTAFTILELAGRSSKLPPDAKLMDNDKTEAA